MLIDLLKERLGEAVLAADSSHGDQAITIARPSALATLAALRDQPDLSFDLLVDLTAVDWLGRTPRFEVVYHLKSLKLGPRLRVKLPVPADDCWAPSAIGLWKAADWLERECFDMFGIEFRDHPDLRRILLYDSFVGYPLRKDYPVGRRQPLVPEIDPIATPRPSSR